MKTVPLAEMKFRVNCRAFGAAAGFIVILALFLAGIYGFQRREECRNAESPLPVQESPPEETGELLYYHDRWYAPKKELETILVLGLDRSQNADIPVTGSYAQSDFIMLLTLDVEDETCRIIYLNRDTMTQIQDYNRYGRPDGTHTAQLTLAYAHAQAYTGSERIACQAAVDAVSNLLYGVEINHYITLTMDGVIVLNDLVGGVEVEITDDFSAVDETLTQGETVTLLGEHALNYVRSRWWVGESSNLERMERQKQYIDALLEKLRDLWDKDADFLFSSLMAVNDSLSSDCTVEQLNELAEKIRTFQMSGDITPEGEAVLGPEFMEFHVNEDALRRLVIEEFYEPADGEVIAQN